MPRNESGQLEPGTLLAGRYRIERFLAGGGMGLVYVAQDQRLADRRRAIKEIFDRFTNPEERAQAIEYFHREADTLSQLKHPAIPAIFDRFGVANLRSGGKYVIVYFDDLTYTARRPKDYQRIFHKQTVRSVPYPEGGREY